MKRKIILFVSLIILIILGIFILIPKIYEKNNIKDGYDFVVTETEINPTYSGYSYSFSPRYVYFDEKVIREYSVFGIIPENKKKITLIDTYEITDAEIEILKFILNIFENNEERFTAEKVGGVFGTYYKIDYNGKSYKGQEESLVEIIENIIYKNEKREEN